MYYSEEDIKKIQSASEERLVDVISDFITLHKSGKDLVGDCPHCKGERTLTVSPSKKLFKCFRCNEFKGTTPTSFLMNGIGKDFPSSLEYLAQKCNIYIDTPEPRQKTKAKPKKKENQKSDIKSYCARMLAESGLNEKDITASVYRSDDKKTIFQEKAFVPGTIDGNGNVVKGDDVIIRYYDLDGFPFKYELKNKKGEAVGRQKEYYRVRWQYPDEHTDSEGKPFKYKSPYGSPTFIYIPERVREAYKGKQEISRLFIQEGEKKAEKASKHGLMSVGISGIQNLGTNKRLPEDLIKIIQTCQVKEVIFLLDADWCDLSSNINTKDPIETRPKAFFSAVKNYKEYMRALKNRDLYVEIYFGYVLKNEKQDKGVDDLLTNSLKKKEDDLQEDVLHLMNEKELKGKYLQLHKITTLNDYQILSFWNLHSPKVFAEYHKDVLKYLPEFKFGRNQWKINESGELESAQPIESDEQFWEKKEKYDRSGNFTGHTYDFKYVRSRRFLQNRGFGRYQRPDGSFQYVHLTTPTIRTVEHWEIRDFLFEFAESECEEDVNEMLSRGGTQYLGPDKLSLLSFLEPNFQLPERDKQLFYFSDKCWEISAGKIEEIDYAKISQHIWQEQQKKIPAKLLEPLFHVTKENGLFSYSITETGKKSHFLRFLINTSNFTWRKEEMKKADPEQVISDDDLYENTVHLVAKLCAIGYMLMEYKDRSVSKAVIAMDGKQSEVGASNGRSGKSILGELFKQVMSTVFINGKNADMAKDQFLWDEVTEKTKCIFIDDVRPGFDFEFLFTNITGDWAVNYKGGRRCTFPFTTSPKLYIPTNHAINGNGSSFKDRQWLIAFSDYYNETRKPLDEFGVMFFDEWDFDQWNLTWNLLAYCVQLYLNYGVVESPGDRLESRIKRQFMGENFLQWADEYFSDTDKLNTELKRSDLKEAYLTSNPEERKYFSATLFKRRIKAYCEWKGYAFNPNRYDYVNGKPFFYDKDGKPDLDYKKGGIEYFIIGDENYKAGTDIDVNADLFSEEDKDNVPY